MASPLRWHFEQTLGVDDGSLSRWHAAVHGVAKSQIQLSDWTEILSETKQDKQASRQIISLETVSPENLEFLLEKWVTDQSILKFKHILFWSPFLLKGNQANLLFNGDSLSGFSLWGDNSSVFPFFFLSSFSFCSSLGCLYYLCSLLLCLQNCDWVPSLEKVPLILV